MTYAVARIEDPYRLHAEGEILPIGTFVSASIQGQQADDVIRVPRAAIRGADQLIFVDRKDQLEIRSVDVVRSDANSVFIRGADASGRRVVLTALESPVNGMHVRTSDASGTAESGPSVPLGAEVN